MSFLDKSINDHVMILTMSSPRPAMRLRVMSNLESLKTFAWR